MAKNKQQIKFEADVSNFKTNIQKAQNSIKTLNNELKLNQSQLKGNKEDVTLLSQRITTLKEKYEEQSKVVENTRKSYEKAIETFGENSKEAENLKNKLIQAETAEQNIKNEIEKTNKELENQINKLTTTGKKWQESGETIKSFGNKIDSVGNKLSVVSGLVVGIVGAGLKYNAEIEKMTTAYETFLGDAKEADRVITQIKNNASKTPFDATSLIKANQMLISTGENAEASQKTILALGNAITATGGGNDELTRMASNLQQIRNAGKATAMDIRQFAYAGIDVYGLLADYMGKTTKEIKDMEISYEDLSGALQKASENGGKYYGAMDKASETLTGQTKQLKAEFKDMTGELTKSLMPVAKKTVGKASELIKKFDDLSDSEKENILKIGLMVAAVGPLVKVFGTLTTTAGSVVKGIGTITEAIGLAKNGIGDATGASANLAKGLKGIVSPAGLATVGIAAYAAAVALVKAKVDKEYESLTKLNEELKNNNEARKSAIEQIENQRSASLGEINNTEKLKNELKLLADENGRVKEGYETRANFILNELNNALGTEYSMTGNVIDNYKNLMDTIDELMAKKKAQIILEANEDAYKEAIQQKDSAYKDYIKTQEELQQKLKRFNELEEESQKGFVGSKKSLVENSLEAQKLSKEIINLTDNLSNEKQTLEKYSTEIEKYEKNSQLMIEGGIENYKKIEESVSSTQNNITKLANAGLNERLQAQIKANEQSKKEYALEVQYNEDAKNSIYATNVKKGQENLQLLTQELIARTSTIDSLGEDEKEAWKTLATSSYDVYQEELSKFGPEMQAKIQEITGVVINGTPAFISVVQKLAEEGVDVLDKDAEFKQKALENLSGYLEGLTNEEKRALLKEAGIEDIDIVMTELEEGDLSEEKGVEILKGLYNGLGNSTFQNNLFGRANSLAGKLANIFTIKSTVSSSGSNNVDGSHKDGLDYVPYDNYIARLHKGERVLTAEENKQYISDNIENKISNRNIVVQFYPQSMTETELQRAENYIAKKWGMAL